MTREEALEKYIIPAIKRVWNEKKCAEVLEAIEKEPCDELDFVQSHKKIAVNLEVCKMRDATQEEREGVERYIDSIAETCNDAISRQDVLDYIYNDLGLGDEENGNDVERLMELDRSYRYVKSLPPVTPVEKWISVSEMLPEKNMACLVAVGEFNLTQMAMYSDLMGTIDHQIFYQGDVGHDNFKNITQYVNAWMPLPTIPPKM